MKRNILRSMLLLAVLLLGGIESVRGDNTISESVTPASEITEILYVVPGGEPKTIQFQIDNNSDKLDGYIRWYTEIGGQIGIEGLTITDGDNDLVEYNNGLAWYRQAGDGYPTKSCAIKYSFTEEQIREGAILVYDASSDNAISSGANNNRILTPRSIGVRHKYIIKNASERSSALVKAKSTLEAIADFTITKSITPLLKAENKSDCVLNTYTIHTPIENGTNYRLPERLDNYYVPVKKVGQGSVDQVAKHVRWNMYNEDGTYLGAESTEKNILNHTFGYSGTNISHKRYILVEVSADNSDWYPVTLLNIVLEPFSLPLTEEELAGKKNDSNYKDRFEDNLTTGGRYQLVVDIPFEETDDDILSDPESRLKRNPSLNYRTSPLIAESYYAFANPANYSYKKNHRLSVGRGEYALYRTLNYEGISRGSNLLGSGNDAAYKDYFPIDRYNISVVDRLWEKNNGSQSGYFMYVDAADDPGVITKIPLENLCANTSLIVSAWICELAHGNISSLAAHADIGFTFKRIDYDADGYSTEVILTKYYTGALENKSGTGDGTLNGPAKWQQVSFKFSFSGNDISNNDKSKYILEISNNCPDSNGADYGIDEIKVYRSLPDIEVMRKDACDASTLQISSDYETILKNMGWEKNQNVTEGFNFNDLRYRKYRYGLMGDISDPGHVPTHSSNVGNVYFAFLDDENNNEWITVNKDAETQHVDAAVKSVRVVISTNIDVQDFPATEVAALQAERTLNIRAINDYNNEVDAWESINSALHSQVIDVTGITESDGSINEDKYQNAIAELYRRLEIPRIRCPWKETLADGTVVLRLTTIDVNNTDLKYKGQPIYNIDGSLVEDRTESGKYRVILFSASQVAEGGEEAGVSQVNPSAPCSLISSFTVWPATTIRIETEANSNVALCLDALRKITATLNGYDTEYNPVNLPSDTYIFDWFLGTREDYDQRFITTTTTISIKEALKRLRETLQAEKMAPITQDMVNNWMNKNSDNNDIQKMGNLLIELIEEDLLVTGTKPGAPFPIRINSEQIVSMPYIEPKDDYIYCTNETNVDIPVSDKDSPVIHAGITGVVYPFDGEVPLRLGQIHMNESIELTIPIRTGQNDIKMAETAESLGKVEAPGDKISLNNKDFSEVGTVAELNIQKNVDYANIKIKLNQDATKLLHEGQSYELLIPFAQYDENNDILSSECDGLASLPIKVVPEYLTWKGDADAVWYNDGNWNQSTEKELYMGDKRETDVNGSDPIENAFAPLYFTKITIDPNKKGSSGELVLEKATGDDKGFLSISSTDKATENIQYDLAVTDDNGTVSPYYINKVSEIYFKPKAKLVNQHHLNYDKAWVEFEIPNKGKRWMTSPLQDVYAGDIYAPTSGRQETEAFAPINYTNGAYSRWNPAFYQKAWNEAVTYYTTQDGRSSQSVDAVQSNWSIEYNDVNVPYKIGKGFYLSVEDVADGGNALVRLPKADEVSGYLYETKSTALRAGGDKINSGRLVNMTNADEKYGFTLNLNEVYGDGKHFLIGNPFMSNLDMEEFFKINGNEEEGQGKLVKTYWVLKDGAPSATVVGTPDVEFGNGEDGDGIVEPMQAFFVELDGELNATNSTVIFTPEMMITTKKSQEVPSTKSASAVNPIITLTAERGDMRSVARLITSDKADNNYKESEDAVVLLDSELDAPMVYSVAGNRAAQVNALRSIDNIPVGVYNSRKGDVTVMIEGMAQLAEPLYLYDAYTRKSTLLEGDSHTLEISGESHGRYYLRSSAIGSVGDNAIAIYSVQSGKVIVSSTQEVRNIKVYSLSGAMVKNYVNLNTPQYTFNLPAGVYVVHAEGKDGTVKVEKVIVR